jgi:hypothetical protein
MHAANLEYESEQIYKQKGWELPYVDMEMPKDLIPEGKENMKFMQLEHTKMLTQTHPFAFWNLNKSIHFLNKHLHNGNKVLEQNQNIKKDKSNHNSFETFVSLEKQTYILQLLENLSITTNGKSILSERKKSAIRGVIEALIEKGIAPNLSYESLYKIFGNKIGLEIKTKLDASSTSEDMKTKTLQYIKDNPFN